jgi:hypothetical protein
LLKNGISSAWKIEYTGNMDLAIEFNPAAFKHSVSEADIRMAADFSPMILPNTTVFLMKTMKTPGISIFSSVSTGMPISLKSCTTS